MNESNYSEFNIPVVHENPVTTSIINHRWCYLGHGYLVERQNDGVMIIFYDDGDVDYSAIDGEYILPDDDEYNAVKKWVKEITNGDDRDDRTQSRIERALSGKTPEEQYDILYWLMMEYGRDYNDSRLARIEWLKRQDGERE